HEGAGTATAPRGGLIADLVLPDMRNPCRSEPARDSSLPADHFLLTQRHPTVGASSLAIAALHPTNFSQIYPNPIVGASLLAIGSDAMCLDHFIASLHFY
ncbi:hypothetical protein C9I49_19940, partial [Pseudomonas prosekii]